MDEQSHALLNERESYDSKERGQITRRRNRDHVGSLVKYKCSTSLLLVLSAAVNVLLASSLFLSIQQTRGTKAIDSGAQCLDQSPYAKLSPEPSFRFPYSTGYGPHEATNHTLADEMWEAIDIDPGIVAVPLDWAEQQNLAETQPFPWDPSKGVYVINAFHTIHCLKLLHRTVYEAHHGWPMSREAEHALHCIDHMRKDTMCNADDFLLATPPHRQGNPGPRGQNRVCKNWDALVEWANDHNACYQHITDDEVAFAQNHHQIERYLKCPPGSPYEERKERYKHLKGDDLKPAIE